MYIYFAVRLLWNCDFAVQRGQLPCDRMWCGFGCSIMSCAKLSHKNTWSFALSRELSNAFFFTIFSINKNVLSCDSLWHRPAIISGNYPVLMPFVYVMYLCAYRELRQPRNYFILNLALTDLLVGFGTAIWTPVTLTGKWIYGDIFCKVGVLGTKL